MAAIQGTRRASVGWTGCPGNDPASTTPELTRVRGNYCFNPPWCCQTSGGTLEMEFFQWLPVTRYGGRRSGLFRPLLGTKGVTHHAGRIQLTQGKYLAPGGWTASDGCASGVRGCYSGTKGSAKSQATPLSPGARSYRGILVWDSACGGRSTPSPRCLDPRQEHWGQYLVPPTRRSPESSKLCRGTRLEPPHNFWVPGGTIGRRTKEFVTILKWPRGHYDPGRRSMFWRHGVA